MTQDSLDKIVNVVRRYETARTDLPKAENEVKAAEKVLDTKKKELAAIQETLNSTSAQIAELAKTATV